MSRRSRSWAWAAVLAAGLLLALCALDADRAAPPSAPASADAAGIEAGPPVGISFLSAIASGHVTVSKPPRALTAVESPDRRAPASAAILARARQARRDPSQAAFTPLRC